MIMISLFELINLQLHILRLEQERKRNVAWTNVLDENDIAHEYGNQVAHEVWGAFVGPDRNAYDYYARLYQLITGYDVYQATAHECRRLSRERRNWFTNRRFGAFCSMETLYTGTIIIPEGQEFTPIPPEEILLRWLTRITACCYGDMVNIAMQISKEWSKTDYDGGQSPYREHIESIANSAVIPYPNGKNAYDIKIKVYNTAKECIEKVTTTIADGKNPGLYSLVLFCTIIRLAKKGEMNLNDPYTWKLAQRRAEKSFCNLMEGGDADLEDEMYYNKIYYKKVLKFLCKCGGNLSVDNK